MGDRINNRSFKLLANLNSESDNHSYICPLISYFENSIVHTSVAARPA